MARIIMADDDEIVGEIAQNALIAAGHGVGLLNDGKDMLAVIRAKRPDLVILDCNMPEMNGGRSPKSGDEVGLVRSKAPAREGGRRSR